MIYDIILNMEKSGIKPRIKVSQYDDSVPQIRATLYSQNQPYTPPANTTAYISGTKADHTGFKYECTVSGNTVTADVTQQMTAFSGDVECEFTFEAQGVRKGTENFILEVENTALADDVIVSESDIPALARLGQIATTERLGVVKVDGTSVTIDADGTLHSSSTATGVVKKVNGQSPNASGEVTITTANISDNANKRFVSDTEKQTWNAKSDFSGNYNDLTNKPTIPDELADLQDDSTHRLVTDTEKSTWNGKSTVSVNQIKSSGEKIAEITVDGTKTDLFASAGGGGGGGDVTSVNGMQGDVVLDVDDINDVQISSLQSGQILKYNGSKWVNANGINVTDIISDGDTSAITSNAVYDAQEIMAKHEDGTTSSKAYAIGDYFIRGGKYCKCISAIASGGTFTKNTNYQETDIGSQLVSKIDQNATLINLANENITSLGDIWDFVVKHRYNQIYCSSDAFPTILKEPSTSGLKTYTFSVVSPYKNTPTSAVQYGDIVRVVWSGRNVTVMYIGYITKSNTGAFYFSGWHEYTSRSATTPDITTEVTTAEKSTWNGKQDALTFTSTPSSSNKVVCQNDLPSVPTTVTGTFTADSTNVVDSSVTVKQYGNVVNITGLINVSLNVGGGIMLLGTVAGVSLPNVSMVYGGISGSTDSVKWDDVHLTDSGYLYLAFSSSVQGAWGVKFNLTYIV